MFGFRVLFQGVLLMYKDWLRWWLTRNIIGMLMFKLKYVRLLNDKLRKKNFDME